MPSLRSLCFRAAERYHEFRRNVRTAGVAEVDAPESRHYSPIPYRHLYAALRMLKPGPEDTFVDYGCGRGRALVTAATYPLREVIGVEIDPELAATARANIGRARGLACRRVRIICADATTVDLPDSATLVYFYNPFFGSVLHEVVAKIRASLDRAPRALTVLYFNRADWAAAIAGLPWVRTRREFVFEYPRIGCGIYDCG